MRKPEVIMYKGYEIVFLDYSNMRDKDEIINLTVEGSKLIRSKPFNSVLSLVNMENMFFNNDIRISLTENVKTNTAHVKMSSVYGLGALISIMYNSFIKLTGRNLKSFKTREEAIEYLIS